MSTAGAATLRAARAKRLGAQGADAPAHLTPPLATLAPPLALHASESLRLPQRLCVRRRSAQAGTSASVGGGGGASHCDRLTR